MRTPRALRAGDRLGIVAPASPFDRAAFDRGVAEVRRLGFTPVWDESVFARRRYLAGSATVRARAFARAWRDPSIAGVMAARGGVGSAQLLPLLDPAAMRDGAKVLIGSSDVTALLGFLTVQCGIAGFHGPMLVTLAGGADAYDQAALLDQVTGARPDGEIAADGVEPLRGGRARGPLLGGTLTQIAASLGTPFPFDPPGDYILLLDEVRERPYRIERMLTQLRQAGVLARARGVVCAEWPECDEPDGGLTARAVVADVLADLPGPILFGLPTGHTRRPMLTVPLGVEAVIEAAPAARLIIAGAAVS